jgi:uncharacterized protein DUF397
MASTVELSGARWRKSSVSAGGTNDECVEVALVGQVTALRDSKNPGGGVLLLPTDTWAALRTHL